MIKEASSCDLKDLVAKFIPESIGREIEKATQSIYPLQNVFIRKVKILKSPKFDLGKLMEVKKITLTTHFCFDFMIHRRRYMYIFIECLCFNPCRFTEITQQRMLV